MVYMVWATLWAIFFRKVIWSPCSRVVQQADAVLICTPVRQGCQIFLVQHTNTMKNIPNHHQMVKNIDQMPVKSTNLP
jgi:hypothetical protein